MLILGSSSSAANKGCGVKRMDKWGFNSLIEKETMWEKDKLLVTSNFSFSHHVFKSCLLLMCQNDYLLRKVRVKVYFGQLYKLRCIESHDYSA